MKSIGFGALVVEKLLKPNGLASPAEENLIKTCGLAGMAIKSLLKRLSLDGAACVSYCVSHMFHTCFIPRGGFANTSCLGW